MLKSFINAETGNKVRIHTDAEPTKEEMEEQLWMEIKWDDPFQAMAKKRGRPKKETNLDPNEEE